MFSTRTTTSDDGNWSLSTQRANAARAFFVANGLRRDQIAGVEGYADQRLRLWHDPTNPRNRRISRLVLLERGQRRAHAAVPKPQLLVDCLQTCAAFGGTAALRLSAAARSAVSGRRASQPGKVALATRGHVAGL